MPTELPVGGEPDALLRRACEELRRQLEAGSSVGAEAFLDAYPELASNPERALELIVLEFVVRRRLGQTPDPKEWLRRFPREADRLVRQFTAEGILAGE